MGWPSTTSNLLDGLAAKDNASWKKLVELYGPVLAGRLLRKGVDRRDVPDLLQEVFLRVDRGMSRFEKGSFRGWLSTILNHVMVDHFRDRQAAPVEAGSGERQGGLSDIAADDSSGSDDDLRVQLLRRVLDVIESRMDRQVYRYFWETFIEGQDVEVVAKRYGVSISAVYRGKLRVLETLKTEFAAVTE